MIESEDNLRYKGLDQMIKPTLKQGMNIFSFFELMLSRLQISGMKFEELEGLIPLHRYISWHRYYYWGGDYTSITATVDHWKNTSDSTFLANVCYVELIYKDVLAEEVVELYGFVQHLMNGFLNHHDFSKEIEVLDFLMNTGES